MLSRLAVCQPIFTRTSFTSATPRRYGCYSDDHPVGPSHWDLFKKTERELCETRGLLFKYRTKKDLAPQDLRAIDEHIVDHRKHRVNDIRDTLKELRQDLSDAICKSNEKNQEKVYLDKRIPIFKAKIEKLEAIDLEGDAVMDRNYKH